MNGLRLSIIAVAVAGTLTLACGGGGKSEPTPEPTQATSGSGLAEVLATYVKTNSGKDFVEDCAKADAGQDAGKICAIARGERANQRAFILGPVASQPILWVILEDRGGGQWSVVQSTNITPDTAAVPGVPWPLRTGVELVVVGSNPCVNVREGPSLNQKAVDCIRDGTKVRLVAGPSAADSIQWWQVEGRTGWVSGDYLRYPDAAQ